MKFRKLRITWSLVWGVLAVLLVVCWVRSYWGRTSSEILVTPTHRYYIHSVNGAVAFSRNVRVWAGAEFTPHNPDTFYSEMATQFGLKVVRDSVGTWYTLSISYWLLEVIAILVVALPWLRFRFSLRTLLIGTTLVAVGLGAFIALIR